MNTRTRLQGSKADATAMERGAVLERVAQLGDPGCRLSTRGDGLLRFLRLWRLRTGATRVTREAEAQSSAQDRIE